MRKLIIVTGISGTGKSRLAKRLLGDLCKQYKCAYISLDNIKEGICDSIGFADNQQKDEEKMQAYRIFTDMVNMAMCHDNEVIIVEYPFNSLKWDSFFNNVSNRFNYERLIINLKVKDIEYMFNQLYLRNCSSERHASHAIERDYWPGREYASFNEITFKEYKEQITSNIYNSLTGADSVSYYDLEIDYDAILEKFADK